MTQSLQNTSLQIVNGLWTPMVFFVSITEFTYYPLVISAYVFSSIIMIIFLLATSVKTKHWNSFVMNIPGPVSILIYNNSTSLVLFVCNLNYNITSLIDLSSNSLFLNNHRIPFLWTSSRNSHYLPDLTLFWSLLTSSSSRWFLSLSTTPSHLFILHMFSKYGISFHVTSDKGSEFVLNFFCSLGTVLDIWLHITLL